MKSKLYVSSDGGSYWLRCTDGRVYSSMSFEGPYNLSYESYKDVGFQRYISEAQLIPVVDGPTTPELDEEAETQLYFDISCCSDSYFYYVNLEGKVVTVNSSTGIEGVSSFTQADIDRWLDIGVIIPVVDGPQETVKNINARGLIPEVSKEHINKYPDSTTCFKISKDKILAGKKIFCIGTDDQPATEKELTAFAELISQVINGEGDYVVWNHAVKVIDL